MFRRISTNRLRERNSPVVCLNSQNIEFVAVARLIRDRMRLLISYLTVQDE
jgi:hypothetical protein